ncbi:MAG: hypothetical protein E7384_04880 [Ruminococcaceae bacterium]|nr:hypothetical protein [Oscillospiraceae bacterium]
MSNKIKRKYDKLSLTKDIIERENIVYQFQTTGFLDRNEAIKKITSLQLTDAELALATKAKQAVSGSVNLYQADDNLIITNMQFQINFLKVKLAKLELEDKENG